MMIKVVVLFAMLISLASAKELDVSKGAYRISFENIKISPSEDMGLSGLSYLFEPNDNIYYGASMYGAVSGKRGGFFVGGFNLGLKYPLYKNFYLDSGVFIGGGGGGSAPQGGGLMLKGYGGGLYEFNSGYSLGINYSYVNFPNGDISSSQLSLVADMKFETLFVKPNLQETILDNFYFVNKKDYLVATTQIYFPKDGTQKVNGAFLEEDIKLLGVEYGLNISDNIITYIESAGALGGDSTGYMEVLGGLGYSSRYKKVEANVKLSLGAGGGGQVDTGGGAITKGSLTINYSPLKALKAGVGVGFYHAFDGNFDAKFAKVQVGLNTNFLSLSSQKSNIDFDMLRTQKFTIRFSHQTYIYDETLSPRKDGVAIELLGTKIDWYFNENFYISGQGFAAYAGGAGGYATGLFGLGYIQPLVSDFSLVGEFSGGAAGGGSIQTGSGMIVQPTLGFMYDINKHMSLELMAGKILAIDGELDTAVVDFSFVYRFDKLVLK